MDKTQEAKDEAVRLYEAFFYKIPSNYKKGINLSDESAKQCALICVDEILETFSIYTNDSEGVRFYKQVKSELKKL